MRKILHFFNHRDVVLILALATGFILGERLEFLADVSVYSLGVVMVFATSGFSFRSWLPVRNAFIPVAWSVLLNYLVFGLVVALPGYFLLGTGVYLPYFVGMMLLVAAPPGPSVVPFASVLKGDDKFSVAGVFGLHVLGLVLAPAILLVVLGQSIINPWEIFWIMVKTILLPLLISRFLRHNKLLPKVIFIKDGVIKWGFFLVIAPIMGMSANVLLSDTIPVAIITAIFVFAMFVMGLAYFTLMRRLGYPKPFLISSTLMLTTKSSAFAAVTAFTAFVHDPRIALPAAIVSVLVTLFVIVFSAFLKYFNK